MVRPLWTILNKELTISQLQLLTFTLLFAYSYARQYPLATDYVSNPMPLYSSAINSVKQPNLDPHTTPSGVIKQYPSHNYPSPLTITENKQNSSITSHFWLSKLRKIPQSSTQINWFSGQNTSLSMTELFQKGIICAIVKQLSGVHEAVHNWCEGQKISNLDLVYSNTFPVADYAYVASNYTSVGGQLDRLGNMHFPRLLNDHPSNSYSKSKVLCTVLVCDVHGNNSRTGQNVDKLKFGSQNFHSSHHPNSLPKLPYLICWFQNTPYICSKDGNIATIMGIETAKHFSRQRQVNTSMSKGTMQNHLDVKDFKRLESSNIPKTESSLVLDVSAKFSGASSVRPNLRFSLPRRALDLFAPSLGQAAAGKYWSMRNGLVGGLAAAAFLAL